VTDVRAIDVMQAEISTIPAVIRAQVEELRQPLRDLARRNKQTREVLLTGCGDSHFAGVATRLAFERTAGVRCRASEALELARYERRYVETTPPPLLVAVSYSGEVGRTIEAAAAGSDAGWSTVAFTGRAEGRLARAVSDAILMRVPTLGFSPGTSTYVAMVTALLLLAAELARANGRDGEADLLDAELEAAPDLAAETLAAVRDRASGVAEMVAAAPVTTFLGAGPSRAAAAFGAAKLFEGPQRYGVAQDLEEWAHEQYFVSGPATPIVVVAPLGASRDRAEELLAEMAFIGAPALLVSDVGSPSLVPPDRHLPIAAGLSEQASGLLTCLPLAMLGYHVAERAGTRSYGFPSEAHEREHYETIHRDTRAAPA
jgi:glucosamine--fructose-6-phosphate aminotransferase (isomerizing)